MSATIGTSYGRRSLGMVPMRSVYVTADELAGLACLVTRWAIEAEGEGRSDAADRLYSRAAALREGSR
ncbi:hypothetical protein [Acidisoma cladoniae]|uniref:hypothetical protein n=1 Tax=Acidisoma cladoniae TaxID=3040935 RepID=UPI00254B5CD7|nr:hypothetical protein [Acidisoma sp. PAMC 29798]